VLAALYRERDIARARATERDPNRYAELRTGTTDDRPLEGLWLFLPKHFFPAR